MNNTPIMKFRYGLAMLGIAALPIASFGQTSAQSGNWTDPSTWQTSVPDPGSSTSITISEGHTVTANGAGVIRNRPTASTVIVHGTLNLGSGTTMIVRRLNDGATLSGTYNINGGSLSTDTIHGATTRPITFNITDGFLEYRSTIALGGGNTFNMSGGTFSFAATSFNSGDSALHLTGGRLEFPNGATSGLGALTGDQGSWNGGAVYLNGFTYNNTNADRAMNKWKTNANNILGISSKTEAQTLTFQNNFASTQGILEFNIYSPSSSDRFVANSFDLSDGVEVRINGVNLEGTLADYIGQSYEIFDPSNNDFENLNPTIGSTTLRIGGIDYHDIIVADWATGSITVVPEPSTYALMFGGLAISFVIVRRRKAVA